MKKKKGRTFRIHLKTGIELKDTAIRDNEVLSVHLPIPIRSKQISNIQIISTLTKPKYIAPEDAMQRTIYFEEKISEQNKTFMVEYVYDNHVDYVDLSPEKVWQQQPNFYTHEEAPHIMFTPYIQSLCAEIVGLEGNAFLKARNIYNFITTRVRYSYMRSYFTVENIVEYAALNLKGDCGVQALLFIALCRCAGIPAKWQSGMYTAPYTIGNHDWAQFYIAPYGWLFADCSFGGSAYRNNSIERWNYYFGNIDPFRMVANSEFQQCFEPRKHCLRIDPYDNQRGECEYGNQGLRAEDFSVIRQCIEIKEL
jgi:transglutaminase-like putative cysteine protease